MGQTQPARHLAPTSMAYIQLKTTMGISRLSQVLCPLHALRSILFRHSSESTQMVANSILFSFRSMGLPRGEFTKSPDMFSRPD